ncbi:putative PQ-loop protein [Paratrimastix pyriformis]|uniref:PQ-loop protein n=1 Tax=Paratrimastix pyriformis TaxID=342808 RepID=A0ABQ8UML9_9EUKA|nr:putative PQ-loop protein [Paratrimastix pyriformis]
MNRLGMTQALQFLWNAGVNCGYIISSVFAFGPQIWYMLKTKKSAGFSRFVCLAIMLASMLRVVFWHGKRFAIVFLYQSFAQHIVQTILLLLSLHYQPQPSEDQKFRWKSFWPNFWGWPKTPSPYFLFLLCFFSVAILATTLFGDTFWWYDGVGAVSLLLESSCTTPQLVHTARSRSLEGLSPLLVLGWVGGDAFKLFFYMLRTPPLQFFLCGTFQLLCDSALLALVLSLRRAGAHRVPAASSPSPSPTYPPPSSGSAYAAGSAPARGKDEPDPRASPCPDPSVP